MKDSPWFKCYPGDFLGGVSELSPAEGWVYTIILMRMYDEAAPVPDDAKRIARRCNMRLPTCQRAIDQLVAANKLIRRDGFLINERALEVIEERHKKSTKATRSAQVRWGEGAEKGNENRATTKKPHSERTNPLAGEARSQKLDNNNPPVATQQPPQGGKSRKRATRLPEGWKPTERMIAYAREKGLTPDEIACLADDLPDWSRSSPNGAKLDWLATWQTWVRRRIDERGNGAGKQSGNRTKPSSALTSLANNLDYERRRHGGSGDAVEPLRAAETRDVAGGAGGDYGGDGAGGNAGSVQGNNAVALVDEGARRRRGNDDDGRQGDGGSPSGMAGGRGGGELEGTGQGLDVLSIAGGDCGHLPGADTDAAQHPPLSAASDNDTLGTSDLMEAPAFLRRQAP
jgi:uncharacterized protein YdaU (DUF1376 family)